MQSSRITLGFHEILLFLSHDRLASIGRRIVAGQEQNIFCLLYKFYSANSVLSDGMAFNHSIGINMVSICVSWKEILYT